MSEYVLPVVLGLVLVVFGYAMGYETGRTDSTIVGTALDIRGDEAWAEITREGRKLLENEEEKA